MNTIIQVAAPMWLSLVSACAPDIYPTPGGDSDSLSAIDTENIEGTLLEDEIYSIAVDATDGETWIYFDLDSEAQSFPENPEEDADWDLAFQRFNIKINGGVHGSAQVQVSPVSPALFEEVVEPPTGNWLVDEPDGDDDNSNPDYVISSIEPWFSYNSTFHTLSPKDIVYVIRSTELEYSKIRIQDYYDEAGTPAIVTFLWKRLSLE